MLFFAEGSMISLNRERLDRLYECRFARAKPSREESDSARTCRDLIDNLRYLLKSFSVTLCGSHPHNEDFDDCWTGVDYATLEEARAVFDAPDPIEAMSRNCQDPAGFRSYYHNDTPYVWLLGPGVEEVRELPGAQKILKRMAREVEAFEREWQHEIARQAGMGGGCEAYNEAMGFY